MRTDPFAPDDLTRDDFLGGAVRLWQPKDGYRAGADPVLLAASVPARSGETVLELGCGGGAALACLGARVPGLTVTGVEMQRAYADLAQRNLDDNGVTGTIHCADLTALPPEVKAHRFDHVIANPPYFENRRAVAPTSADRAFARSGALPLAKWVSVASKRLAPGGMVTFIQRIERLPELMSAFYAHLGALELWPIQPRTHRAARLFLLRGRKTARAAFVSHPPLVLHRGDHHEKDGDSYTKPVSNALRSAQPLPFPD
ncbi:methyltransferase [Marivita sp. S6314]|uniref:tRNA1(Val) (adenine(37)-N6)-methyltransferase n=1 Tax=Marivita sp. S6314 TaxID=2926406 RepID=UPI001FF10139|nr:methyltransferase [Marivita sp. S6314]MCK0151631.1 methyltransferase [Marivita sp. S6314]